MKEYYQLLTQDTANQFVPFHFKNYIENESTRNVASTETDSLWHITVLFQQTFYATGNEQRTQKFTSIRFHLVSCDLDAIL